MDNNLTKKIAPLDREQWQNYRLPFHYISHNYYDVALTSPLDGFNVSFTKKPFAVPYEKTPDDTDKLFQPWWDDIQAWGIVEKTACSP